MSIKKISSVEIILWLFAFILVLVSLSPLALGFKIKSDYSLLIEEFSELTQFDIKLISYDQGFFSSQATVAINIPDMEEQLQFKDEIIHGPVYFGLLEQGQSPVVVAVVKGQLDISASQRALVNKIFAGKTPLVYQMIIDFSGEINSQAYVPAVNARFDDEYGPVHIQSAGIIVSENYSMGSGQLRGELDMPTFKIKSDLLSLHAESINMSFSGAMGGNDILLGDSVLSMNLLDIDSGEEQFAMRDLVVRSVSSESAGLINTNTRINARELLASNQKFGPLVLNLIVNGLDAESLNKIQDIQNEIDEKLQQGLPAEQVNAMMTGQIMGIIPDLIKQTEVHVSPLSINSELGKLEADLDFSLDGIDSNTPADPMFLLGAISLDLNLSIDEALLRQFIAWELENNDQSDVALGSAKNKQIESKIPMDQKVSENIQGMLDENWMLQSEGVYLSKISMHQGELLINNKPVDPMQQIMSSMNAGGMTAP